MIDLQKFCATDTDPRPHIRRPTRCAEGIVATNGQILICVPDDGRECDSTGAHWLENGVLPDEVGLPC